MGTSSERILTSVDTLGVNVGGDAFIKEADAVTVSAKSLTGGTGTVDVQNTTGTLTAGHIDDITPSVVTNNASGYSLPTKAFEITGGIALEALAGQLLVAQDVSAKGNVALTGKLDNGTAIRLADGVKISDEAGSDQTITLKALLGDIVAGTGAQIEQTGANGGAIYLLAGMGSSTAIGAIDVSTLQVTQKGTGGVNITTGGTGNVAVPRIINDGAGEVVVGAGILLAAGDGSGGQLKTVTGNTITQNSTGATSLYSGNPTDTGELAKLDTTLATLFLSPKAGQVQNLVNASTGKAYTDGPVTTAQSGSKVQVMFREKLSFDSNLVGAQLNQTYGDANTENTDSAKTQLIAAMKAKLKEANGSAVFEKTSNAGLFKMASDDLIDDLAGPLQNAAYSSAGFLNQNTVNSATTYAYDLAGSRYGAKLPAGQTATVLVAPKPVTATLTDKSVAWDGSEKSLDAPALNGFLAGDNITAADFDGVAKGTSGGSYNSDLKIKAGTANSGNYAITVTNATLTITNDPAPAPEPNPTPPDPAERAANPLFKVEELRNVERITRISLSGFSGALGTGAAVAGRKDFKQINSAQICTPETDADCACETPPGALVEICTALK